MTNSNRNNGSGKKELYINFQQVKDITNKQICFNNHFLFLDHITKDYFPTTERKTQCLIIIYCKKGGIKYEYAGKTYRANKQDLIILNTDETFFCKKTFCQYEGMAIFVANKDILSLPFQFQNSFQLKKNLRSKPIISLSYQDCDLFTDFFYKSMTLLKSTSHNEEEKEKELQEKSRMIFNNLILCHHGTYSYEQPQKDQETEKKAIAFKEYIDKWLFYYKNLDLFLEDFKNQNKQFISKNSASCFKECFGIAPTKYIYFLKINLATQELQKHGKASIEKLSQILSYRSSSTFCRTFKNALGKSPHKFKTLKVEQQQNTIHHTIPFQIFALAAPLETYIQEDSALLPS